MDRIGLDIFEYSPPNPSKCPPCTSAFMTSKVATSSAPSTPSNPYASITTHTTAAASSPCTSDSRDGMPSLMDRAVTEAGFLDRHLPFESVAVNEFRIPRFKISFGFKASKALESLGVSRPFRAGGLTEMVECPVESRKLYVYEIYQKSLVEVNVQGTEAAAVSAVETRTLCLS